MKKNLILIRANKTKFGGAENYLAHLSKELTTKGITTHIIHSPFSKLLPAWLRALLFNYWVCVQKKDRCYFSLERITCADIYRAGDGVHKIFLTRVKKSKLNPLHLVYQYLEKRCFINCKHIIANSQMIKSQIIQTYGINTSKITVIYNGINLNTTTHATELKKEFNITNEHILLYIGSGFKRKGVREFLELIAKLRTGNTKAFVVGKEKQIQKYTGLAKELGIADKVIFTGSREDAYNFYALSDIFILPTYYDPFSNVVLEAMSQHNAVFTTKDNGASEILKDEYIMHSPDEDISQKIDNLLNNSKNLEEVKSRNYQEIQAFSIEENARQTLKVIKRLRFSEK